MKTITRHTHSNTYEKENEIYQIENFILVTFHYFIRTKTKNTIHICLRHQVEYTYKFSTHRVSIALSNIVSSIISNEPISQKNSFIWYFNIATSHHPVIYMRACVCVNVFYSKLLLFFDHMKNTMHSVVRQEKKQFYYLQFLSDVCICITIHMFILLYM